MSRHPAKTILRAAVPLMAAVTSVCGFAYAAGYRQGASVANGLETATAVCSACHVVADHQDIATISRASTPSFQDIADNPGTSAGALRQVLRTTHWDGKTLPTKRAPQHLTAGQTADVSRYILSLRRG